MDSTVVYYEHQQVAQESIINVSLAHQTPQEEEGKEGSGDHAYSELFSWNAIIAKNVTDNRKNCMAGHTRVPQV